MEKKSGGLHSFRAMEKRTKKIAIELQPKRIIPMPLESPTYLMSLNLDKQSAEVKNSHLRYQLVVSKHKRTKTEQTISPLEHHCALKVHAGKGDSKGSQEMFQTKR